jgi:hypothetical protein
MRARERDLLILQLKFPTDDYCYPIPREVDDIYSAPSDGGSYWRYSGFEHYYFEQTHHCWSYVRREYLSRETAWKEWITKLKGK